MLYVFLFLIFKLNLLGVTLKAINKQEKQTKTHRHRQQHGGYQREGDWRVVKGKGGEIYGDR